MLLGFKVGFIKAGPREGAYGYQRRRGEGERDTEKKRSILEEGIRPVRPRPVRPCTHKLLLSNGLWPLGLGGQVTCPTKGFAPASSEPRV
jgi:hypothetical protein